MTSALRTLLLSALFFGCASLAVAQTMFVVAIEAANDTHPNPNPYYEVYVIDGVQGRELTLRRGTVYTFRMQGISGQHPFYLTTNPNGGGAGPYLDGVTNTAATGDDTLLFAPSSSTPDLLYYGCYTHQGMGWRVNVVDREAGVREEISTFMVVPQPAQAELLLTLPVRGRERIDVALVDPSGAVSFLFSDVYACEGVPLHLPLPATVVAGNYLLRVIGSDWSLACPVAIAR